MAGLHVPQRRTSGHDGVGGPPRSAAGSLLHHGPASSSLPALVLPDEHEPVLLVGRSRTCDVVLTDPTVSRAHAALMRYAGRWHVVDRGSTNGTWVNDRQVWGTAEVRPGDRVGFGEATYVLVAPA